MFNLKYVQDPQNYRNAEICEELEDLLFLKRVGVDVGYIVYVPASLYSVYSTHINYDYYLYRSISPHCVFCTKNQMAAYRNSTGNICFGEFIKNMPAEDMAQFYKELPTLIDRGVL